MSIKLMLVFLILLSGIAYADLLGEDNHSINISPGLYCEDGSCNNGETCASCPTDCGTCQTGSSGGGGHGHATVTVVPNATKNCSEDWICAEWSNCTNSEQTRECGDWNHCNTTKFKPTTKQVCILPSSTGNNTIIETVTGIIEEVKETIQDTFVELKETTYEIKEQAITHWQFSCFLFVTLLIGLVCLYQVYHNGMERHNKKK